MEIKSIRLININLSLEGYTKKDTIIYENKTSKPINIIYMPNTRGKTLVFNSLKHLFSYDIENYIKRTNTNLEVEVKFRHDGEDYIYTGGYHKFQIKFTTGADVKDFGDELEKDLGIFGTSIKYNNKRKNTLNSINRFSFLSFEGIPDNEESNEISFINTAYDGGSKKLLLVYFLGADVSSHMFNMISDYEFKKLFISEHENKFIKYETSLNQLSIGKNHIENIFEELQKERNLSGDLNIAIKELNKLLCDYVKIFGDKQNEDLIFLKNELYELKKIKERNIKKIKEIKNTMKNLDTLEQSEYLGKVDKKFKKADLLNYEKYKKFRGDLESYDNIYIDDYIKNNIDNYILEFKSFLNEIYEVFVTNLIDRELLLGTDKTKIQKEKILFNENTLSINIPFGTSEGFRKAVRVLSFVGLHFYSGEKETRNLGISFYDTFIENTGGEYREAIFDTIVQFAEKKDIKIPQMFLFISDIEGLGNCSINEISKKHNKYINLIKSEGVKEIY